MTQKTTKAHERDGMADAIAATVLIAIVIAAALYWVSSR